MFAEDIARRNMGKAPGQVYINRTCKGKGRPRPL